MGKIASVILVISSLLHPVFGQDVPYFNSDLNKTQDIGAINTNFRSLADSKDVLSQGDIPPEYQQCIFSPMFCVNQYDRKITIVDISMYLSTTTGSANGICFSDGTCQTSAGIGSSAVSVNTSQISGDGTLANPLTLISSSVTLQGNTFNGALQLLQADSAGKLNIADLPTDGYSGTYINVGEQIPGSQVDTSTITSAIALKVSKAGDTMTGALIGTTANYSSSVTASEFYGNGATLTGVITSTGTISSQISALEAWVSTGAYRLNANDAWVSTATSRLNAYGTFITTATHRLDADLAFKSTATARLDAFQSFKTTATTRLDNLSSYSLSTGTQFGGDVSGLYGAISVSPDSHVHFATSTLFGVIASTATGHYGISVASASYAPGDNLGNHAATQDLSLATYNIDNVDRMAVGVFRTDWAGETEYGREPTFEMDIYGNSAIQRGSQIFAQNAITIGSTSVTTPNVLSISIDCVTAGCGKSSDSDIVSDNGTYFRFYGGNGDSLIIETAYWNIDVPADSTIIGAKGFVEKYTNNIDAISLDVNDGSYCKLGEIGFGPAYGYNQCRENDWTLTSSIQIYGNSTYSWGYQITPAQANSNSFGWRMGIKLLDNATAYIDVMKMQLFYVNNNSFKMAYNADDLSIDYNSNEVLKVSTFNTVAIMATPNPAYALNVTGKINSTEGFFKAGVEIGGGGDTGPIDAWVTTATYRIDALDAFKSTGSATIGAHEAFRSTATYLITAHEAFKSTASPTIGAHTAYISTASALNGAQSAFISTATIKFIANDAYVSTAASRSNAFLSFLTTATANINAINANISTAAHYGAVGTWTATQNFQTITSTSVCIGGVCSEVWPEGGAGGGTTSFEEDNFYAQTNGVQTQFTLSLEPVLNSLMLTKNGVAMVAPADYSLSGQVITMVTAPVSSTTLVARYAVGVSTDLASVISDGGPIGEIIQYSSTASPAGFLYADGSYVSTTTYSALFAVTGHRYSTFTVTGSPAVFQLPDFRGMFARGAYGNLNSRDPEVRVVGSTQTDTMQGHQHSMPSFTPYTFPPGGANIPASGGPTTFPTNSIITDGTNGTPRTSVETRPENIAVAFHIRYANIGTPTITLSTTSAILASNNSWTGTNSFSGATAISSVTFTGGVTFNVPTGSSVTWSCPTAFTAIQRQGSMLGCMQTGEEGAATFDTANNTCFQKYGGKIADFGMMMLAFGNYVLTDETDDYEWTSSMIHDGNWRAGLIDYDASPIWANSNAIPSNPTYAYRCWTPK